MLLWYYSKYLLKYKHTAQKCTKDIQLQSTTHNHSIIINNFIFTFNFRDLYKQYHFIAFNTKKLFNRNITYISCCYYSTDWCCNYGNKKCTFSDCNRQNYSGTWVKIKNANYTWTIISYLNLNIDYGFLHLTLVDNDMKLMLRTLQYCNIIYSFHPYGIQ